MWLQREEEEEEPLTEMEEYVQYNQLQWHYYNELYNEVHNEGVFGAYLTFLLSELEDGPYWSHVKQQFGTVEAVELNCGAGQEREPEPSGSGTRNRQPDPEPETDSDTEA